MFSSLGFVPAIFAALLLLGLAGLLYKRRVLKQEPRDLQVAFGSAFSIKPYLQLGDHAQRSAKEQVEICWHTHDDRHTWKVQVRAAGEQDWRAPLPVLVRPFFLEEVGQSHRYSVTVQDLPPGERFEYRLLADGDIAFQAAGFAPHGAGQPFQFAIVGDLGNPEQFNEQKIAHQIHKAQPNFMFIPGDIAYERGRVSEYLRKFYPVYNCDRSNMLEGAPLLRSLVTLALPGNHDMGMPNTSYQRDLDVANDLLAYFQMWSMPLNGPQVNVEGANRADVLGSDERVRQFLANAGKRFPGMGMYSFDWGNLHWTVLDSNAYMDWTDAALLTWLEADLQSTDATWKFVSFHHPPFSSNATHVNEQRMRLIAPVLERNGVDVVFNGHNHCYERTHPLRFVPTTLSYPLNTEDCAVNGDLAIDTEYGGGGERRPDGIIYVTDGSGGAKLHRWQTKPDVKPYTAVFDQERHSFTLASIDGRTLTCRQISADGEEIDRWTIRK